MKDRLVDYTRNEDRIEDMRKATCERYVCPCGATVFEVVWSDEWATFVHCVACDKWDCVHEG